MTMARASHSDTFKQEFGERLAALVEHHLAMGFSDVAKAVGYANSSTVLKAARAEGCLDVERLALLAGVARADGKTPNLHWLICGHGPPLLSASADPERGTSLDALRREITDKVRQLDRQKMEAMLALLGE